MNKYNQIFNRYEINQNEISKNKNKQLCKSYYKFVLETYGKEKCLELYNKLEYNIVLEYILTFSVLDEISKKWILEKVLPYINKESLLSLFINILTDSKTSNNINLVEIVMESIKKLGLVKSVTLNENNMFILITNNDKEIKFRNAYNGKEDVEKSKHLCHAITYELIKHEKDHDKIKRCKIVTILEKSLFNTTRYHSFILYGDVVNDFARNLIIKFENYKKIFNPEIILCNYAEDVIRCIDNLEKSNLEFEKSNLCKVLKYAIHKQTE